MKMTKLLINTTCRGFDLFWQDQDYRWDAVDYVFVGCSVVYGCFIENEAILPASAAAVRVPELIA